MCTGEIGGEVKREALLIWRKGGKLGHLSLDRHHNTSTGLAGSDARSEVAKEASVQTLLHPQLFYQRLRPALPLIARLARPPVFRTFVDQTDGPATVYGAVRCHMCLHIIICRYTSAYGHLDPVPQSIVMQRLSAALWWGMKMCTTCLQRLRTVRHSKAMRQSS